MTTKEKKQMIARFIELHVFLGYDITGIICRPLSWFDYTKLAGAVAEYEKLYENQ